MLATEKPIGRIRRKSTLQVMYHSLSQDDKHYINTEYNE